MLNDVKVIGKVVKDPELRYTTTGKAVATVRLMIPRGRTREDGADFVDCEVWERSAENIANNTTIKGTWLLWSGRLRIEEYEPEGGGKRSRTKIVGNYSFLPGTGGGANSGNANGGGDGGGMGSEPNFKDNDDVPF